MTWKIFLLALVTLVSFSFFDSFGTGDILVFHNWITATRVHGLVAGYAASAADYPPLSVTMLNISARISESLGGNEFTGVKALIAFFLCLSSVAVYAHTSSLVMAAAAQLVLSVSSLALGYMDVCYTPTLILALSALKRSKLTTFALLYTLGVMIKWQSIIILPFFWIYAFRLLSGDGLGAGLKKFAKAVVAPTVAVTAVTIAIYGPAVLLAFHFSLAHAFLSAYAMNLNWIVTHVLHVSLPLVFGPLKDGVSEIVRTVPPALALVSRLLFGTGYLAALYLAARRPNTFENVLVCALLGFVAHFTFNLGVHENHLYVAMVVAVLLYVENSRRGLMAAFIVLFFNLNLFLFYGVEGLPPRVRTLGGIETSFLASIVWVAFALAFFGSEILSYVRATAGAGEPEPRPGEPVL